MDKLEYIPGDLVMTNGVPLGTAEDVVYRVSDSDPSKTLKLDNGTVLKGAVRLDNLEGAKFGDKCYLLGDCGAWVKDIVPITLTQEILKKNGWICKKGALYDVYKKDIYTILEFVREEGVFNVCVGRNNYIIRRVMYVHQLQHLLFGLGLNSEMEV